MATRFLPPAAKPTAAPSAAPQRGEWSDDRPQVVVYTRAGCCLCDEAIDVLRRHGLTPKEIDIDSDEALRERYTNCVPVVTIDGKERFRGRVNEVLLKRLLA